MPAAENRSDLLSAHDREFAKLIKLLDEIDDKDAILSPQNDAWRIQDIVAHRAHWIGLFFTWYEGGKAGQAVQTPAPGYKWNQLKPYNAAVRERYSDMAWPDVLAMLRERETNLRDFIAKSDDAELYTKQLYPWLNNWTLGRWAEASGASAFRSAIKHIRKTLRENR